MKLEQLAASVIQRLTELGYPSLDRIREFETEPQDSVKQLRASLEEFFREMTRVVYVRKGVQFRGDATKFADVRQFINAQAWLTNAESQLVASFYKLLSAIIHEEQPQSKIDFAVAYHLAGTFLT